MLLTLVPCTAVGGKSLLLTGGTGFVGKVLIERLLDKDDVESIHLLVRQKRGVSVCKRAEALSRSAALSERRAKIIQHVTVHECELSQPGLGLVDLEALERLRLSTTHIIHLAASVDFDLPIARAAEANVGGALNVLEFAKQCPKLEALVHCSTAYVAPADPDDAALPEAHVPSFQSLVGLDASQAYDQIRGGEVSQDETRLWLEASGHPNTYTFTKALAEEMLLARRGALPLCIVRPSIISASLRHPMAGWIDSDAAFAAFVAMFGRGWLHSICAVPETPCDIVPCDYVADRLMHAAFDASVDRAAAPVIYAVAGRSCSLSIARIAHILEQYFQAEQTAQAAQAAQTAQEAQTLQVAQAAQTAQTVPAAPAGTQGVAPRAHLGLLAPASNPHIQERIQEDIQVLRQLRDATRTAGRGREAVQFALLARALSRLHEVFPHFHRTPYRFVAAHPIEETLPNFDAEAYVELAIDGINRHLIEAR